MIAWGVRPPVAADGGRPFEGRAKQRPGPPAWQTRTFGHRLPGQRQEPLARTRSEGAFRSVRTRQGRPVSWCGIAVHPPRPPWPIPRKSPCFPVPRPLYGAAETWPSGRRHTPAKGADGKPSRGFESLRLRHTLLIYIEKIAAMATHPPSGPPLNLRLIVTDCGFERCRFVTRWDG